MYHLVLVVDQALLHLHLLLKDPTNHLEHV